MENMNSSLNLKSHKSHNPSDFKKSLEVINLSQSHGHQYQSLKERPHDNSAVGVFIDSSVDPVPHLKEIKK